MARFRRLRLFRRLWQGLLMTKTKNIWRTAAVLVLCLAGATGCHQWHPAPGARLERRGDEIMACGQLFHTGAPVVLWDDPGGYDAYRIEKRFEAGTTAPSYHVRMEPLTDAEVERVKHGDWTLDLLRQKVD